MSIQLLKIMDMIVFKYTLEPGLCIENREIL